MVNFTDFADGGTPSGGDYVVGYAAGGAPGSDRRWLVGSLSYASGGINVVTLGADPTGVADSAPAFRAAGGSNRVIFVPPGSYLFSSVDAPPFTPHAGGANYDSYSNFMIIGYGATVSLSSALSAAGYATFVITRCSNFQVYGMKLANGIGLFSDVNFHISDLTFAASLTRQAFFGDYLINGTIDHITVLHGQVIDMAYITHMRFDDIRADGGGTTPSGLAFGISGDTASLAFNATGVTIDQSDDVCISNCNVTGYATGVLLREGRRYKFNHNAWHDLDHASISPIGVYIAYSTDLATPSTGFPVKGVSIIGDTFADIGATTAGHGIMVDASNIVNADLIADVTIGNCGFDGISDSAIGMQPGSETHVSNMVVASGNTFTNTSTWVDFSWGSVAGFINTWGFGYNSISGGSQTQTGSKSDAVTLNRTCGNITMQAANLAAGTIVSFTLNNTFIRVEDNVICQHVSAGTVGAYGISVEPGFQSAIVHVRNNTGGGLAEAIVLKFTLIKGGV